MNRLAFFFPAKIVFAESAIELTPHEGKHPVYLGPIGRKYYFKTDKGKVVFERIEDDKRQVFLKVKDCFCPCNVSFIDNIPSMIETMADRIEAKLPIWEKEIENPLAYEQKAAETRAKINAEREEQDKRIAAQKLEREQAAQKDYEDSLAVFKAGIHMIEWGHFERACKENNVKLPIKTLGFGRANVAKIGQTGYSVHSSSHNSPVLWAAIQELSEKLLVAQ